MGTLFIDFRKAFDVVDHILLIKYCPFINLANPLCNGSQAISVPVYKQYAANKGYQNSLKRHRVFLRGLY